MTAGVGAMAALIVLAALPWLGGAADAQLQQKGAGAPQQSAGTAADVQRVADWVRDAGNPSTIGADWLPALGLGPASLGNLPTRNRSYGFEDGNKTAYAFSIVIIDGREEMVAARALPGDMTAWRIDRNGTPLVTVHRDASGTIQAVASAPYVAQLRQVLRGLAEVAAKPGK